MVKKKNLINSILVVCFLFVAIFLTVACGKEEKYIKIEASETFVVDYYLGDEINLNNQNLKCYKTESQFDEVVLTTDMISNFDTTTVGYKTLTINYQGLKCDVDYKVLCRATDVNNIMATARNNFINSNKASIVENKTSSTGSVYYFNVVEDDKSYYYNTIKDSNGLITNENETWIEPKENSSKLITYYKTLGIEENVLSYTKREISSYGQTRAESVFDSNHYGEDSYNFVKVKNIELTEDNVLKISYEYVELSAGADDASCFVVYEIKNGFLIKETCEIQYSDLVYNTELLYTYNENAQGGIVPRPTNVTWEEE